MAVGFGVVGVGNWGRLHARVYDSTPGARLAALCDANLERARNVADSLGGVPCFARLEEMLDCPDVEAVSVVLPDHLHRDAAVRAAESGRHVLLEKPLATTEQDAQAILRAVRRGGGRLMVDFHNRWSPLFQPLKGALERGELGDPLLSTLRLNDTLEVPTRMLPWADCSSPAWFLGSHCVDTLLWLMEARQDRDVPVRLTSVTRSRFLAGNGISTPDFCLTTLEWRSGLVTHVENGWVLPESGPSLFDLKCQFVGTRGAVFIDASHHRAVEKHTERVSYPDVFVAPTCSGRPEGFAAESIRHFVRAVIEGTPPAVDGLDGLAATRLVLRMEESSRTGQPVEVGPLYEE